MDDSRSALRPNYDLLSHYESELAEGLQSFQWVKRISDEMSVRKIFRARKDFGAVVTKFEQYSDEIAKIDADNPENLPYIEQWRQHKNNINEIYTRMEKVLEMAANQEDDDPFAADAEEPQKDPEAPTQADVQASLALGDEILREMDAQTARLQRILRVTEELKDLADHCLEELADQKERLLAINRKLRDMDVSIEEAQNVMVRIRVSMAANRCLWISGGSAIGAVCLIIIIATVLGALCANGRVICNG